MPASPAEPGVLQDKSVAVELRTDTSRPLTPATVGSDVVVVDKVVVPGTDVVVDEVVVPGTDVVVDEVVVPGTEVVVPVGDVGGPTRDGGMKMGGVVPGPEAT